VGPASCGERAGSEHRHPHRHRRRCARLRRRDPALAGRRLLARRAGARGPQRRRRGDPRDLRCPAVGGGPRRHGHAIRRLGRPVRGRPQRGVPARDPRARRGIGVPGRQRGGAGHRLASAGRPAPGRSGEPADRPGRCPGQRLGDHDRRTGVHRTRRGPDRRRHGPADELGPATHGAATSKLDR
jgi:hypothetical protein